MKKLSFLFHLLYVSTCVFMACAWFSLGDKQMALMWVLVAYWCVSYALKSFRWYKI